MSKRPVFMILVAAVLLACLVAVATMLPREGGLSALPASAESSVTVSVQVMALPTERRPAGELQRAIDQALPGSTVTAGCVTYMVDSDRPLTLRSGIDYDFERCAFVMTPNARSHYSVILARGISDFSLRLGIIVGDRPGHLGTEGEWGHGLAILGCSGFVVESGLIVDAWGDGVYLGVDGETQNVDGVLRGLTLRNNRRNNLSVISLTGGRIESCVAEGATSGAPGAGIDIEPNRGARVRDLIVSDFTAVGNSGDQIVVSEQSTDGDGEAVPRGIRFERCIADGRGVSRGYGFLIEGRNVTLIDCRALDNRAGPVRKTRSVQVIGGDLSG